MRMLGNVLQTRSRGQFVLDFLHDEIGEVLHALGGAAHAHELRNKYCKHLFIKNKENLTLDGRWTRQKGKRVANQSESLGGSHFN